MYLIETTRPGPNGTVYRCVLLRQSYREGGKVKNRTLANLSHCTPQEIEAIRVALHYKDDLAVLGSVHALELQEGRSVGAVCTIYDVARQLGLEAALGTDFAGKLALWQVMARVIDQGSRLSAVRLAQTHAACELLGITRGFDENDLYDNLAWLADHQGTIERRVFTTRRGDRKPTLFLYDVTSSYLEGQCNAFAAFGYNRDGKAGKNKWSWGCCVTKRACPCQWTSFREYPGYDHLGGANHEGSAAVWVRTGDVRGRPGHDQEPPDCGPCPGGFHYITALTKPQVERLLKHGVLQLALFTAQVCEVEDAG